jgi:3-oxoacyl-[acyl-carrier-protein] synthase III
MSSHQPSKSGPVIVIGTGRYNPTHVLTNAELERRVDTSDEWITTRTGIKERRIAAPGEHNSDMATKAAMAAMEQAKIKPADVDLIICGTVTGDMPFPATSCLVQKNLGAFQSTAFDLGAACTGFIYGLEIARQLIHGGNYHTAVVIGSERISSVTDWTDRNTCVLFGDGAGAAVLQRRAGTSRGILATDTGSDGRYAHILHQPGGGTRIPITTANVNDRLATLQMSGKEVFKQAVSSMTTSCQIAMEKAGVTIDDIALVIPHQANYRIIDAVGEKLKAPPERVYKNVQRYGNTGAAAVAMALDEAHREGRFKRGDKILLVAFGAGLTWGSTVIEW